MLFIVSEVKVQMVSQSRSITFVVAAFVLLTIRGFFHKNQKQYHKFSALQAA